MIYNSLNLLSYKCEQFFPQYVAEKNIKIVILLHF